MRNEGKGLADSEGKPIRLPESISFRDNATMMTERLKPHINRNLGNSTTKSTIPFVRITGQKDNPAWFISQTGYTYSPNPATQPLNAVELWVGMAQWEFCQETPNCFLIGPDYQLPDKGGHLMTNGSRWLGCYFAKAKDRVLNQRRPFQPLAPIEFTCVGRDLLGVTTLIGHQ
ncbi:hypothetical protein ACHWUR_23460 [Klebsiella pneumoniae]